eukprot:8935340-Pyramimonas_sp.AAC.1
MVVLAGLAWNPPTSCAWASRVYVDKWTACSHGMKVCLLDRLCFVPPWKTDSPLAKPTRSPPEL